MAYKLYIEGYKLGFSGLLQIIGIILSGLISFGIALFVLRRQRRHDIQKEKINKSLELLKLIAECARLLRGYASKGSYENSLSNLSDEHLLDKLLSNMDGISVLYHFVKSKVLNLEEVEMIYKYFIYKTISWKGEESEYELVRIGYNILKKLDIVEKEIRDNLKK